VNWACAWRSALIAGGSSAHHARSGVLLAIGVAAGLPLAFFAGRALKGLLFGVTPSTQSSTPRAC